MGTATGNKIASWPIHKKNEYFYAVKKIQGTMKWIALGKSLDGAEDKIEAQSLGKKLDLELEKDRSRLEKDKKRIDELEKRIDELEEDRREQQKSIRSLQEQVEALKIKPGFRVETIAENESQLIEVGEALDNIGFGLQRNRGIWRAQSKGQLDTQDGKKRISLSLGKELPTPESAVKKCKAKLENI